MGKHLPDPFQTCPRNPQQAVFYADDLLSYYIIFVLLQQIIYLADDPRRGILYGQHRKIRSPVVYGIHGVPKGVHMKAVHVPAEVLQHGRLRIGALRPLKHHSGILRLQTVHADERQPSKAPALCQALILQLPAHGHDLLKQLLHSSGVELAVGKSPHLRQLLQLPLPVQNISARGDLVLRHLPADVHAPLVQLHDFAVYLVYLFPQF